MNFVGTSIEGVWRIELAQASDHRGSFSRVYCQRTFQQRGLHATWVQFSVADNLATGTVRGLHWQTGDAAETKLIRCERGRAWDCLVDVRESSPTFGKWQAFELAEDRAEALYVPVGIAHGYQTLQGDTRMSYLISADYDPMSARGIRWDDGTLSIPWPLEVSAISDRDRELPFFSEMMPES